MRKGKVLAVVLVTLALAGGAVAYVERCYVIAWYQTVAARVHGAKDEKGLYYCPMHPSFTSDRPGNCAICGMSLVKKPAADAPAAASQAGTGGGKILYYRNPMDPTIHSPVPMKDQMGMDYVPVYEEQAQPTHTGVYINSEKQQLIGVKKGKVQRRRLSGRILTVGRVAYDPKLFVAQQEYLQALKGQRATQSTDLNYLNAQSQSLLDDMRYKLLLMGMSNAEVDELAKKGEPETNLYLPTPQDKQVWVYITIYEYEAGFVQEGLPVVVDTLAYPGESFRGRIVSITPLLEVATRTLKVRALVDNPEDKLKLEMFANVRIDYDLGEKLAVPEEAVMHAGTRNIIFLADADGYFTPKTVTLGAKAQGYYEVLQGLSAGQEVVTSGNFLVDSESKLNAVLNQMEEPNQTNDSQHD
ncbi:MAG: efflux RND transporter periplasmic adaptor subunit [Planctomycetes bacterium]|nr:efflux RND transporter periplasmic adaptor subunit [Planctomycetota bacterium]